MRRVVVCVSLVALIAPNLPAQETGIPPRFRAFARDGALRLQCIMGTPEIHPSTTSAFSANGKIAVYVEDLSTGIDDKRELRSRVVIFDVGKKSWLREIDIEGKAVTALSLSADGSKALVASQMLIEKPGAKQKEKDQKSGTEKEYLAYLSLWNLNEGKQIHGFATKEELIWSVALSTDGHVALSGGRGAVTRWDLKQGKELAVYKEPVFAVALAFLPKGDQFLGAYRFNKSILWDVHKEKAARIYQGKQEITVSRWLAVSRDGKRFVNGDFERGFTLWDTNSGKEVNTARQEERAAERLLTGVAIADDGKTVFSIREKENPEPDDRACAKLIAWDGEANKTLWSKAVPYRGIVPLLVQGDKLLVGGGPNRFDVWSIKTGKLEQSWGGHKGPINQVAVLGNGDILSAGQEGEVMTWRKNELLEKTPAHKGAITALALSKDKKQWLTAGADLQIKSWPADAKRAPEFKKKHTGPITSLAVSSSGQWAASGSADRTVRTCFVATGEALDLLSGHAEGVNAVAISPDDRWLASASDDTTIKVWPIKDGKLDPDRDPITLEKHTKPVTCLAFTPDGKRLLSGSQDQKLMVWNWQKGSMDFMIPGHKNWINSILLLDADTVLTSSDDLSICAWDLRTGMEIGRVDFGSVGDCPRCLAKVGPDRFVVGSSSWLVYEFQLAAAAKSK